MSDRRTNSEILLGRRIASYHPVDPSPAMLLALGGVSICSLLLGITGWLSDWPSRWLLVAGLVGLLFSAMALRRRRTERRIDLYQRGICLTKGRRHAIVLWDDVRELYQIPIYRPLAFLSRDSAPCGWSYRLFCRDGRKLHLSGYDGIHGLGRRMQRETSRRMMPLAIDSFQAGYVVRFGRRVAISDEGVHLGFKCHSWHEVADITVDEADYVRVARAGHAVRWVRIPVSQVANAHVLAKLLDMIRDTTARSFELNRTLEEETESYPMPERRFDLGHDLGELASQGYDVEDIREVISGESTIEELMARGPRRRPRHPR